MQTWSFTFEVEVDGEDRDDALAQAFDYLCGAEPDPDIEEMIGEDDE